jgi:predicted lipid carrier protein YhbT
MLLPPDFRFPAPFAKLGRILPAPLAGAPLMLMLELARRRQWLLAPESLYGKTFQITVEDFGLRLSFICDQGKFRPAPTGAPADVRMAALALDFFKLACGLEDADTLFFRRRLRVEGDTELGIAVKYWLDASERPAWLTALAGRLGAA